jgi:hypothetical protein
VKKAEVAAAVIESYHLMSWLSEMLETVKIGNPTDNVHLRVAHDNAILEVVAELVWVELEVQVLKLELE